MAGVRAVVVGAGGISRAWFPPLIEEKVQIPAVVDLNPASHRAQAAKFRAFWHRPAGSLVRSERVRAPCRAYKNWQTCQVRNLART